VNGPGLSAHWSSGHVEGTVNTRMIKHQMSGLPRLWWSAAGLAVRHRPCSRCMIWARVLPGVSANTHNRQGRVIFTHW
jgi:hypothetical protein